LFELINDLCNSIVSKSERLKMGEKFEQLLDKTKEHFKDEESFLSNNKYDEITVQKTEHGKLLEDLAGFRQKIEHCNAEDQMECIIFLKNWMITHTLVHDKRYGQFMNEKGIR